MLAVFYIAVACLTFRPTRSPAANRQRRGRPIGSEKESTTIRFDRDILAALKKNGLGWQTRMNAARRDWLKTHSAA
jgi:uncharacterized protein (DUF4415 family)